MEFQFAPYIDETYEECIARYNEETKNLKNNIYNNFQEAEYIFNSDQKAEKIHNSYQEDKESKPKKFDIDWFYVLWTGFYFFSSVSLLCYSIYKLNTL